MANRLNMLTGQSLKPLAILVAWSMQWPEVTKLLLNENHQVEICDYLADICKYITADGKWQMKAPTSKRGKKVVVSECKRVLDDLKKRQEDEQSSPSHWSHLPWAEWLYDQDFLACLKYLDTEQLWEQIKKEREDIQPENTLNLTHLMRL